VDRSARYFFLFVSEGESPPPPLLLFSPPPALPPPPLVKPERVTGERENSTSAQKFQNKVDDMWDLKL